MATQQERISAKIKKILAIAGDDAASDEEIQNAMAHAQRLMDDHHITEADLAHEPKDDYQQVDEADFNDYRSFVGKRMYAWESHLGAFVSQFVGVGWYVDKKLNPVRTNGLLKFDEDGQQMFGKSIVFYGVAEDAAIAAELYTELRTLIATLAVGRWGSYTRKEGASYSQGFVIGLFEKHSKARLTQQSQGGNGTLILARRDDLVKYKMDRGKNWLAENKGITLRKGGRPPGSRVGFNGKAYGEGIQDGKAADVDAARRRKLN